MDDIWIVYNHISRRVYALVHKNGLQSINTGDDPDIRIIKFGSFGAEIIRTGDDGKLYLMDRIMFVKQPQ